MTPASVVESSTVDTTTGQEETTHARDERWLDSSLPALMTTPDWNTFSRSVASRMRLLQFFSVVLNIYAYQSSSGDGVFYGISHGPGRTTVEL
jgi:uncharacterized circularly permuted ATP-grasp superfamily protein